jgi:hypothetical protein
MTRKRRAISRTARATLFAREAGRCHLCQGLVSVGQAWDVSHDRPLAMGGADDETNWKVAHRACHRAHTAAVDVPQIAKAKRRSDLHTGATRPKQSIPARVRPKAKRAHEGRKALEPRRLFKNAGE